MDKCIYVYSRELNLSTQDDFRTLFKQNEMHEQMKINPSALRPQTRLLCLMPPHLRAAYYSLLEPVSVFSLPCRTDITTALTPKISLYENRMITQLCQNNIDTTR